MNKLESYKQAISESYKISSPLLLENALQQISSEKNSIQTALNESGSIKVPLVGDFNSGKSSLLNEYVGRENLLPTNIVPETAVAYEIYFDINEHVELFRDGIKIEEAGLDNIKQFATRPGDIAKVYLNSPKIKELSSKGITLVDMPGIDSGLKEHNDAILNYINKGTVFILCVDCAGGSLRQSTLAFLGELSKYNLKPAIMVTKTDKKTEADLSEVVEYISFQAEKELGEKTFVGSVSAHGHNISSFEEFINSLNVASLIKEKFSGRVAQFMGLQLNALNAQARIYSSNIEDAQKQIEALEAEKLKAETAINDAKVGDSPEKSTQDVLDLVTQSLRVHNSEIARMAVEKESPSEINARIINYIRPVIVLALREEGEQYAAAMNSVVDEISTALQNNITIDGNIFENLVDEFHNDIVGGINMAANILLAMPNVLAKALGWILKLLGEKVPDLLKWILGKSQDSIILEVTQEVDSKIIPQITERLRPEILQQITAQQQRIRQNISANVVSSIGNFQDSIIASKEAANKAELEKQLQQINSAIQQISIIKDSL